MKNYMLIILTAFTFSCSTETEEIDHSKYQLVGTTWTSFDRQQDGVDIYHALHFNKSTVSKYSSREDGEKFSWSASHEFEYSLNENEVIITEFGTGYAGTKSGDIIHIFDRDYKKQ